MLLTIQKVSKKYDNLFSLFIDFIISLFFSVIFICRRGNDSQIAVNMIKSKLDIKSLYDVEGGYHAWSKNIDNNFPYY